MHTSSTVDETASAICAYEKYTLPSAAAARTILPVKARNVSTIKIKDEIKSCTQQLYNEIMQSARAWADSKRLDAWCATGKGGRSHLLGPALRMAFW